MKNSHTILIAGALLGLSLSSCNVSYQSGYNFDYKGSTAQYDKDGVIPVEISALSIDHRFGDVHINPGASGNAASWRWEVTTWADDAASAQLYMDQISLETITEDELMSFKLIIPDSPGWDLNGIKSVLWLNISDTASVELSNTHGDAFLQGLSGDVRSNLRHGDADYRSLSGEIRLEHAHGSVQLNDVQTGSLHISHGDLQASAFHQAFELRAEHSGLILSQVEAGMSLDASHSNTELSVIEGAFRFDGRHSDLQLTGDPYSLDLNSSFGHLTIRCEGMQLDSVKVETKHADTLLRLMQGFDVRMNANTQHGSANISYQSTEHGKLLPIDLKARHGSFQLLLMD